MKAPLSHRLTANYTAHLKLIHPLAFPRGREPPPYHSWSSSTMTKKLIARWKLLPMLEVLYTFKLCFSNMRMLESLNLFVKFSFTFTLTQVRVSLLSFINRQSSKNKWNTATYLVYKFNTWISSSHAIEQCETYSWTTSKKSSNCESTIVPNKIILVIHMHCVVSLVCKKQEGGQAGAYLHF